MWYKPELVQTEKELEDEELKELVGKKLREDKKKKKKEGKESGEVNEAEERAKLARTKA